MTASPGRAEAPDSAHAVQHLTHAGGGDENAVHLTLPGHLGIAGHHAHTGFRRGFRHGLGYFVQLCYGEALLNDEGAGEIKGLCAHAAQVVYRAADGELADVAAGEVGRGYDKPVGGHGDFTNRCGQDGGVVRREIRVVEILFEKAGYKLRRLSAAGSVGESDIFFHFTGHSFHAFK
jgi:hypothetical protein